VALDRAALLRDASARRDQLQAVIAAVPDAVLLTDPSGRVEAENPAAVSALGSVVGQPLDEVLGALPAVPGHDELRLTPGGRFVAPRTMEAATGTGRARFAMLLDRTELVQTEAARDTFVGMLSHELRTPITTIYASAQLLRRDPPAAQRRELLDELGEETDRLRDLVEDLLVLSRYERGRLDAALEPVMVGRVVAAALEAESARHPGMRTSLAVEPGLPPVLADPTYLRQIVRNLVSNAAKYAGTGATVAVAVGRHDDRVRLTFEDDGPGIAPESHEQVFGLFERLPASGSAPGAGIGLFVCRQLAHVMGGSLTAVAGSAGGAGFVLDLPAMPHEVEPRAAGPAPGARAASGPA
jgi:signal transduction histidine kinase